MCDHKKNGMIGSEEGAEQGNALRSEPATASQRTGFAAAVQTLPPPYYDPHPHLERLSPAPARRKQAHTARTAHFGLLFSE